MFKIPKKLILAIWILALIAVVVGSLLPGVNFSPQNNSDKIVHFLAYFGMSFLSSIAFKRLYKKLLFALMLLIVGVLIELGQNFIPSRSASMADIAANSLGIFCGILLSYIIYVVYNKFYKSTNNKDS